MDDRTSRRHTRPRIRSLTALLPCLAALWAGVVPVDGRAEEDVPDVVYLGVPAAPGSEEAVRRVLARARPAIPADARVTHLDTLVSPTDPSVLGATAVLRCTRTPEDPADYQARRDALYRAFLMQEEIAPLVEGIGAAQLCSASAVPADELAWPSFLDAIVAFENDEPERARERFAAALAVHPEQAWDSAFPEEARALFDGARQLLDQQPRGELQLAVPAGVRIWIDGREVSDPTTPLALAPGRHLVQSGTGLDLHLRAVLLTVEPGRRVLVLEPDALVPTTTGDDDLRRNLAALLSQLGGGGGGPADHVVVMRQEPQVLRWNPGDASLTPLRLATEGADRKGRRAALGVSAGLVAGGAAAAIVGGIGLAVNGRRLAAGERWITPDDPDDPTLRSWRAYSVLLVAGTGCAGLGGAGLAITVAVTRRNGGRATAWVVSVGAEGTAHGDPGGPAGPSGFHLGLTLRPARSGGEAH